MLKTTPNHKKQQLFFLIFSFLKHEKKRSTKDAPPFPPPHPLVLLTMKHARAAPPFSIRCSFSSNKTAESPGATSEVAPKKQRGGCGGREEREREGFLSVAAGV
jgi:hypothetical protein